MWPRSCLGVPVGEGLISRREGHCFLPGQQSGLGAGVETIENEHRPQSRVHLALRLACVNRPGQQGSCAH